MCVRVRVCLAQVCSRLQMPQSATHTETVAIADVPRITSTPCGRTRFKCALNALKMPSAGVFIMLLLLLLLSLLSLILFSWSAKYLSLLCLDRNRISGTQTQPDKLYCIACLSLCVCVGAGGAWHWFHTVSHAKPQQHL